MFNASLLTMRAGSAAACSIDVLAAKHTDTVRCFQPQRSSVIPCESREPRPDVLPMAARRQCVPAEVWQRPGILRIVDVCDCRCLGENIPARSLCCPFEPTARIAFSLTQEPKPSASALQFLSREAFWKKTYYKLLVARNAQSLLFQPGVVTAVNDAVAEGAPLRGAILSDTPSLSASCPAYRPRTAFTYTNGIVFRICRHPCRRCRGGKGEGVSQDMLESHGEAVWVERIE